MMIHLDALWLSCVISDSQYARGVYEWKRRILRLAGQIRQIATRAVLAARRVVIVGRGEDPVGSGFDIAAFTRDVLAALPAE